MNAQCPSAQSYSPLKAQFAGHTTLICLPKNQNQTASIIQEYAKAKKSAPHDTAAIFIAPCFNRFHSTLLENKGVQREKLSEKLPQPKMSSLDTE
eukprot:633022-Pelagomonas_calceolata.AAC.1